MKYYSEHTKQFYDSVEECEKAENELVEAKKKAELEAKAKSEAREKRAKEVEEAMKMRTKHMKSLTNCLRSLLRIMVLSIIPIRIKTMIFLS